MNLAFRGLRRAFGLLAAFGSGSAGAAEPVPVPASEPVRAQYSAPAGCPSEEEFRPELAARLAGAAVVDMDSLARRLVVTIEPSGNTFLARVELADSSGRPVSREVSAPSCAQAMQAIALIAALAARSQFEEEAAAAALARPATAAAPAGDDALGVPPAEPVPVLVPAPDPVPSDRTAPRPARRPSARRWHVDLLGAFVVSTGVGPGLTPGVGLRTQFRPGGSERSGPVATLSATYSDSLRRNLPEAEARFREFSVRPEFCPLSVAISAAFGAGSCLGFELGAHFAEAFADGTRVVNGEHATRFWAAASLALRGSARLGAVTFELGPELRVPFTRTHFMLSNPERDLYTVPAATLGVGVAAGGGW